MSIQGQVTRLENAKSSIKSKLELAGVTVPNEDTLDDYPDLMSNLMNLSNLYKMNHTGGWVGNSDGKWTPEDNPKNLSDIWVVQKDHQYRVGMPTPVGTRFRLMFTTVDITKTSEVVQGTHVTSRNPAAADSGKGYPSDPFTAPDNGYLILMKDNTGNTNCRTMCYDLI